MLRSSATMRDCMHMAVAVNLYTTEYQWLPRLCCALLCCAVPCCAMQCRPVLCCAVPCLTCTSTNASCAWSLDIFTSVVLHTHKKHTHAGAATGYDAHHTW